MRLQNPCPPSGEMPDTAPLLGERPRERCSLPFAEYSSPPGVRCRIPRVGCSWPPACCCWDPASGDLLLQSRRRCLAVVDWLAAEQPSDGPAPPPELRERAWVAGDLQLLKPEQGSADPHRQPASRRTLLAARNLTGGLKCTCHT